MKIRNEETPVANITKVQALMAQVTLIKASFVTVQIPALVRILIVTRISSIASHDPISAAFRTSGRLDNWHIFHASTRIST